MNSVIEYTSSKLLIFCCAISGIIKAMLELTTARIGIFIIQRYLKEITDKTDYLNLTDAIQKIIKDIQEPDEKILLVIVALIICDLLTYYAIHMLCDKIAQEQTASATTILNESISNFFFDKQNFISFVISNFSTIIKSENQSIETFTRNITIMVILLFINKLSIYHVLIAAIFGTGILFSHLFQIYYNKKILSVDIRQLNALNKFIDEYKQINNNNYLIYGYAIIIGILYTSNLIKYSIAIDLLFILSIRIIINMKISRMPIYLKKLTANIQAMLQKIIIQQKPTIANNKDYSSIITKNLNVNINYNNKNVNMIHDINRKFNIGEIHVISSNTKGKTVLLNHLLKPLYISENVFFINSKNEEHSINNIKNITESCIIVNNNSEIGEINYTYDTLIEPYNASIKRIQICKIMHALSKNIPFVGIDNEIFINFSVVEINKILQYIQSNSLSRDKLIIITVKEVSINIPNIHMYSIKNGELIKI